MATLRQRFFVGTGLLLGLQVASAALALGSWQRVVAAGEREDAIAEQRVDVVALGSAIREAYVHQAHTYIEGGPGHLGHGGDQERFVTERLAALRATLPADDADLIDAIAADHAAFVAFFHEQVEPLARAGALDPARSSALHATTERLVGRTTAGVDALVRRLDARQAAERDAAGDALATAWWATAALTGAGVLVVAALARALARAVLAPEAQIRAAEDRRVRVERLAALGEMSAAIAHELLNPLAVILGHVRLAGDPSLEPVRAEAEHARRVVEGLLGFARPGEEPAGPVDLADVVRDAVDRALPTADARGIELRAAIAAVPPVTASPSAVRQVLDNLVRNALEASPDGGVIDVELRAGPEIRVLDRGPGIPDAVRARLYEPFATGRDGGTGLGLAISQRIARAMGGRLVHEARDGGGTIASWRWGEAHG